MKKNTSITSMTSTKRITSTQHGQSIKEKWKKNKGNNNNDHASSKKFVKVKIPSTRSTTGTEQYTKVRWKKNKWNNNNYASAKKF